MGQASCGFCDEHNNADNLQKCEYTKCKTDTNAYCNDCFLFIHQQQKRGHKSICGSCDDIYKIDQLSICEQKECKSDYHLYCEECFAFIHQNEKRGHKRKEKSQILEEKPCEGLVVDTMENNCIDIKVENEEEELQIAVALENKLQSNYAALKKLDMVGVQCEICRNSFNPETVFICEHNDCKDDGRILCEECGEFLHRNKNHKFHSNELQIICVKDIMDFKEEFKYQFVGNHDDEVSTWKSQLALQTLATATSSVGEQVFIWRDYYRGEISLGEAASKAAVSVMATVFSYGVITGCATTGALIGVAGGPIGAGIGAVIGILFGLTLRFYVSDKWERLKKIKEAEAKIKLQKEAFKFFFRDENYNIDDVNMSNFNDKSLKKRYRQLALECHPDKNNGDGTKWFQLTAYYGILIAILEQKNGNIELLDDGKECQLSIEQKVSIANSLIKENARLIKVKQAIKCCDK